ncbi:MAG: sel1 repeat family protein [Alphaproteobacteria bacterium]|nr:sel1 repeat family protein [Alphaproteobacteria bacterium]
MNFLFKRLMVSILAMFCFVDIHAMPRSVSYSGTGGVIDFFCDIVRDSSCNSSKEIVQGVRYWKNKKYKKAFDIFAEFAKRGFRDAEFCLAVMYQYGWYGGSRIDEAVKLYKSLADKCYIPAMYNLAVCYEDGNGCSVDLAKAFSLYNKIQDVCYLMKK